MGRIFLRRMQFVAMREEVLVSGQEIAIKGADGDFTGYLAKPASGKGPGVVVIQEILGVNPWIREVADFYAAQGYIALAPDLFWRFKPGIQLDATIDKQFQEGLDYYGKFNVDTGVKDIQAAISTVRSLDGCTGKVGNIGFCLGGFLAYLTAARTDTDGTASYYGGGIHTKLNEAQNIRTPTVLHLAGADAFVPKEATDAILAGVKANPNITAYVYPGMPHAFCRANDPRHFNRESCTLAHTRTLDLFKRALA
jgi:carboxymethylenebutenolidase